MNFVTTIGLEVHVELKTNSKIFSPSPVQFGSEPKRQHERDRLGLSWGITDAK